MQSVDDNTLQVYLDAVQSAKARGVFQDRGVLFAIYDPYGKRLKMYHYWLAVGNQKNNDGLTNAQCSTNIIGALRVKDIKRKVDTTNLSGCEPRFVGDKQLMYCKTDKGSFYYDTTDKNIVNVTPINGALCRRQVNDVALKQAHILLDGEGRYDRNNNVIYNVGQEDAAKIVAKYAYYNKIQYALFVVETFDVWTEEDDGLLETTITYHYYEVPKYYGIIAGINAGTSLGNGYYMVDGQGIGNLFDRSYNEIFTKSESGWSLIGVILISFIMISIGNIAGVGLVTGLGVFNAITAVMQNMLDGTNIFGQPWAIPIGKDVPDPNRSNVDPTPRLKTPALVDNEHISKDTDVKGGEGASQITDRVTWGNENKQYLRGFKEPARERGVYQNWNKAPGGFIQLPSR
jgi:hypothetical protein